MIKSDLLHEEVIQKRIEDITKAKDYLILAATGQVEKNDELALVHLQNLVYLGIDLKDLLDNLPFITVDINELSKAQ